MPPSRFKQCGPSQSVSTRPLLREAAVRAGGARGEPDAPSPTARAAPGHPDGKQNRNQGLYMCGSVRVVVCAGLCVVVYVQVCACGFVCSSLCVVVCAVLCVWLCVRVCVRLCVWVCVWSCVCGLNVVCVWVCV